MWLLRGCGVILRRQRASPMKRGFRTLCGGGKRVITVISLQICDFFFEFWGCFRGIMFSIGLDGWGTGVVFGVSESWTNKQKEEMLILRMYVISLFCYRGEDLVLTLTESKLIPLIVNSCGYQIFEGTYNSKGRNLEMWRSVPSPHGIHAWEHVTFVFKKWASSFFTNYKSFCWISSSRYSIQWPKIFMFC